ncbi:MAG TPA: acetolactate synthase small subunit [Gemmatimonadaceae bacterium]|nr:acetolactate synthase small subunit [Gemmatimonadaceae bacterium]
MAHTLLVLMEDHPGVLHRAVSLFRRRGYNIESLAVGRSETPGVSRMTVVVESENVEQVAKQLYRLIEVLKVTDVTNEPTVERETALVKVHAPAASRAAVVASVRAFEARTIDVGLTTMIVEITGAPEKVDSFIEVLRPFGVKEMTRSGRIAMTRGARIPPRTSGQRTAEYAVPEGAPDSFGSQADGST